MSPTTHHRWSLPEGDTVFEFDCALTRGAAPDGHVAVTCRWSGAETQHVVLHAGYATPIALDFRCGYRLRGSLRALREANDGIPSIGLYADLRYDWHGRQPIQHFQGMAFLVPEHAPAPPPPPPPPLPPPSPVEEDDVDTRPIITPHDELFPYLYVRRWPNVPADDLHFRFFSHDPASRPAAGFLAALAACPAWNRVALALAFVNGAAPWQGRYVAAASSLPGPLGGFARLARTLRRSAPDADWAERLCVGMRHLLEHHGATGTWLLGPDYAAACERVWESHAALTVLLDYDQPLRIDLTLVLWLANAASEALTIEPDESLRCTPLSAEERAGLADASLLLPARLFPARDPGSASPPAAGDPRGWIEPYAVGDLQMVRQRLLRYGAGEIARIENVLRGERREVSSRHGRQRLEHEQRSAEDAERLENTDADTRLSLSEEASRTVAGQTVGDSYDNFTTSYGPPTQATLSGSLSRVTTAGPAGSDDMTRFAREILGKAVGTLSRKVGTLRASSSLSQVEDAVVSVIDNTGGSDSLCAVYRWVNKIYEARVVNYGNRLMVEFVLLNPGAALRGRVEGGKDAAAWLVRHGVRSFEDIGPLNYARLCAAGGVTDVAPPPGPKWIAASVRAGDEAQLAIPPGYCAVAATAAGVGAGAPFTVMVGCQSVTTDGRSTPLAPQQEASVLPLAAAPAPPLSPPGGGSGIVNVGIACSPSPRTTDAWRIAVYAALLRAQAERDTHHAAPQAEPTPDAPRRSPLAVRRMMREAIRHGCTELLLGLALPTSPSGASLAPSLASPPASPPAPPQPLPDAGRPRLLQFLDAALEWTEMSYTIHHARPEIDDAPEHALARFRHADHARALVPVRPDHVLAFLHYRAAGTLCGGPDRLVSVHACDLPIVDDLKRGERGAVGERLVGRPWEVVVPTAMQVLDAADPFAVGGILSGPGGS